MNKCFRLSKDGLLYELVTNDDGTTVTVTPPNHEPIVLTAADVNELAEFFTTADSEIEQSVLDEVLKLDFDDADYTGEDDGA